MADPKIRTILLPTDFSDDAQVAFYHALKVALAMGADLDIFHVEPRNDTADWHWGPKVAPTLARWGVLGPEATVDQIAGKGIRARRHTASGLAAPDAILRELAQSHADLVVMASHGRQGVAAWLQPSVTNPIATRAVVPVLLLPPHVNGFVEPETGESKLRRILIPIDHRPHPAPGFDAAVMMARALCEDRPALATLHIGPTHPETDLLRVNPTWEAFNWRDEGPVVETILYTAQTWSADLIVLVTEGRHGFLDAVRGSTAERLVQEARVPILVVPHNWGWKEAEIGENTP